MKQIRKRLTYANIMSSLAIFLVLGGAGAIAASKRHHKRAKSVKVPKNSVGTKQLKRNAVTTLKIRREAITKQKLRTGAVVGPKIANGAVSTPKIAGGAVGNGQLADSSVSSSKLDGSQRSEAVAFSASSPFDLFDNYDPSTWSTVMSIGLPGGNWVVNANVSLEISSNVPSHVGCRMLHNGAVVAQGGTEAEQQEPAVASYDGVALSAVLGAGTVTVTCGDDRNGTIARYRSLVGTRVGSVSG